MTPEEFWAQVDRSGECWLWQGPVGYDRRYNAKRKKAA